MQVYIKKLLTLLCLILKESVECKKEDYNFSKINSN